MKQVVFFILCLISGLVGFMTFILTFFYEKYFNIINYQNLLFTNSFVNILVFIFMFKFFLNEIRDEK